MSKPHSIIQKLSDANRGERKWLWVFAICMFATVALSAVCIAGFTDYWFRFENYVSRVMLTYSVLVVAIFAGIKLIWPVISYRRKNVELARHLESLNPNLGKTVSLAASFISHQTENGSAQLRNHVVQIAGDELQKTQLTDYLRTAWPMRAIVMLLAVVVVIALMLVVSPQDSEIAVQRLAKPLSTKRWPSVNQLSFESLPKKIAAGEPLKLYVVDKNSQMPSRVVLHIDDGNSIRKREMRSSENQMVYRIDNVLSTLSIRASGGDGKTEWKTIDVIQAPKIQQLSVQIEPPKYSELPVQVNSDFQKIWAGSVVAINGIVDKGFSEARVVFSGDSQSYQCRKVDSTFVFPASGQLRLSESKDFRIELVDEDGIVGGTKRIFRIPVRTDEPPFASVKLVNSQELYSLDDQVEFNLAASDDMKIKSIFYCVIVDGKQVKRKALVVPSLVARDANQNDRIEIESNETIELKRLQQVGEKSEVSISATVTDAYGNQVTSSPITFRIGTKQELINLKSKNRNEIFELISSALQSQTESENLVRLCLNDLTNGTELTLNSNRMNRAVAQQQNVDDYLFGAQGVVERARQFELQIQERPSTEIPLNEVVAKIAELQLPQDRAKNLLYDCLSPNLAAGQHRPQLQLAFATQQTIIEALQSLVGKIGEQTKRQSYLSEIANLVRREKSIKKELTMLQKLMLQNASKTATENSEASIQIERIENDQVAINDRLTEIAWSLNRDAQAINSAELNALAATVKSAEVHGRTSVIKLAKNQVGLAISDVQKVIELLGSRLNQSKRSAGDGSFSKKQIADSQSEIKQLRAKQQGISKQLANWSKLSNAEKKVILDSLDSQQARVNQFQNEFGPKLSDAANQKLSQASSLLSDAKNDLENNDAKSAQDKLDQATENLNAVEQELNAKSDEAQRNLRNERFQSIQKQFTQWFDAETLLFKQLNQVRLAKQNQENSTTPINELLSADDQALIKRILAKQKLLNLEFKKLPAESKDFFVLKLQLKGLSEEADLVVNYLSQNQIANAKLSMKRLLDRLQQLGNSKIDNEPPTDDQQNQNTNRRQESTPKSGIAISEFEVQLLRLLQRRILHESAVIEQLKSNSKGGREAAKIKSRSLLLSEKQGELIDTINKYLGPEEPAKNPTNTIPEIPPIDDIPNIEVPKIELPEIDLDKLDIPISTELYSQEAALDIADEFQIVEPFVVSNNNQDAGGNKQIPQEPRQQKPRQQKPPAQTDTQESLRVETVAPLSKDGEDAGEQSDETKNRLQQVREKMLRVQELMIQQKFESENRDLQNEIIEDLKLFVTDQKKKSQKPKSKNKDPNDKKKGDNAAQSSQSVQDNNKKDPQDENSTADSANDEFQKRFEEIWGHLPERLRHTELNIRSPKFLPKYKELIQQYFKRLAKEKAN